MCVDVNLSGCVGNWFCLLFSMILCDSLNVQAEYVCNFKCVCVCVFV